jgi:hypothetical protein
MVTTEIRGAEQFRVGADRSPRPGNPDAEPVAQFLGHATGRTVSVATGTDTRVAVMNTPCLLGFCVWTSRTRTGDLLGAMDFSSKGAYLQGICEPPSAPRVAGMHVDYRRLSCFGTRGDG